MNRLNDNLRCIGNTTYSAIDAGRRLLQNSYLTRLFLSRAQHDKALGAICASDGQLDSQSSKRSRSSCVHRCTLRLHLEEPRVNPWVSGLPPNVPFLRGTVVVPSFLQAGDGRELPLNVATLYGKTGIEAIVGKPALAFHLDGIPCNT